jgi:hypothetical protein
VGRTPSSPLTPAEAKARLRAAAASPDIAAGIAWVESNPGKAMALAAGIGLLLGASSRARQVLARALSMAMKAAAARPG